MNIYQYGLKARRGFNFLQYLVEARRHPELARNRQFLRALNYSRGAIRFFLEEANRRLVECALKKDSVVFDVGGDVGNWAQAIVERYDPRIYIFEPNPRSGELLEEKFKSAEKVAVMPFGLSDRNSTAKLSMRGMGSSVISDSPQYGACAHHTEIELRDIAGVVAEMDLESIDLFKVNIEGSEYPLLLRMIEAGLIEKCKTIRIQFHEWYPGARRLRKQIRTHFSKTHTVEWDYPFVWESWQRK